MGMFRKFLRFVSCSTVKESKEVANVETGSGHLDSELHLDGLLEVRKEEARVETGSGYLDSELHLDGVLKVRKEEARVETGLGYLDSELHLDGVLKVRKEEAIVETGSGYLDSELHLNGVLKVRKEEAIVETGSGYLGGVLEMVSSNLAGLSTLEDNPLILEENSPWADQMVEKIQSCQSGLRYLRIFASILQDTDAEIGHLLMPVNPICEVVGERHEIEAWILDLEGRIQKCKHKFEQSKVELLLGYSLRCINPLNNTSTVELLAAILQSLKDLCLYKFKTCDEILLLNNQIEILQGKVTLLHNFFTLTPVKWMDFKEIQAFIVVVHVFAQYSASLVFLYWVKAVDKDMAAQLNVLFSNALHEYRQCVSAFTDVYIRLLEEMKSRQLASLLSGQIIHSFLDLLLENLIVQMSKEDFQIVQVSLTFVIYFLAQPPDQHEQDEEWMTIAAEIEILVKEHLYIVKEKVYINGDFSEVTTYLSGLMRNVEQVKGKILQAYDRIRDSFSYDFPKVNGLGFFYFLLQNLSFLKEKLNSDTNFIPFAKNLVIQIEVELMSLRPYLDDLFERQKKDKELKDTWLKVIDLAYQSEYAINSCLVPGNPLWYSMAGLMEVLDKLKDVKKIEGTKTHDGAILHCSSISPNRVPQGPSASSFNDGMVGLEEEAEKIVRNLINGSKSFDIVAIVGMPGIGKTTMANKVYNAPIVRDHFHVFAYCVVSQVYGTRRILLDILGGIIDKDDKMYEMMEDDLAQMLRQRLLGKRYLIIMDDIWDVKSWDYIKSSLPNKPNGSKVLFTTRNRNVARLASENCILHHLRFLSDEESWEMLQRKAFHAEGCPQDFQDVGRMIAKNCKGLPLTIVSIADLVAQSETISSYVSTQRCIGVLESSYQHLPEHLKPCFLYFGAFAEDRSMSVNKLILLWIAEGFVQKSNMTNLECVARGYLCDLVDRSLVIPDGRSSYGGIKSCRIHDLVREFCQRKAEEENIFHLKFNNEASSSSSSTIRNPYRVSIHMKENDLSFDRISPTIRSLLINRMTYLDAYHNIGILKLVQVMFSEGLEWDTDLITRAIASLVHLRFIATSIPTESGITIPSSVSNLWNLETLILTAKRSISFKLELPGTVWNMTKLKHVDVGLCYISNSGVKKGETYPQMINLESLSSPYISSTKDLEDLLRRSPSLQKLSFHYELKEDFHFPELDSLNKLESLKVSSARDPSLHSFNFLSSLKKLSLSDCLLLWEFLPVISKMPCLEVLKLLDESFVWLKWDMKKTKFPKLKFLKLQGLKLAEWIVFTYSFPQLEVLIVNRCSNLNTIPECFGEMPTLKRIEVYASPKAAPDVVEIQEVQEDLGNDELQVIVSDSEFPE